MANETECVNLEIVSVPAIEKMDLGNCGAGIVLPPPPPQQPDTGLCRKIVAYEKPDNKLFSNFIVGLTTSYQIETKMNYFEPSLPDDLWGPPLFNFYIPMEARRGDKIYISGSIQIPTPNKGNGVYWASTLGGAPPGFYLNTNVYMQLGSIFVSDLWAPREELRHLGPDTFVFYCPQFWRSKSGVNIISWSPFLAEVCLVNQLGGFPPYSQLVHTTPHYFTMEGAYFPSPDCGMYGGQSTTIVLREVFTEGGYPCASWQKTAFGIYDGSNLSPADILGWTGPPEDPNDPGVGI